MTEKPRRPSAEIRAEIESAEAKLADIDQRISDAMATIDTLREESRKLYSPRFRYEAGVIPDLKRELYSTLTREEFDAGLTVVWVDGDAPSGCKDWKYVVTKVTAKRIFIRDDQHFCDEQYKIDGGHPRRFHRHSSHQERIDIQATFGVPEITAKLWAEMKGRRPNEQPK